MSNVFSAVCTVSRDAEVRYLQNGGAVLGFNAANNIGYGDRQKTNWICVSLFGKQAEGALKEYLKKGQQVFVSGELSLNEYETREGTKATSLEIRANTVTLVGRRREESEQQPKPAPKTAGNVSTGSDHFDDDIPF